MLSCCRLVFTSLVLFGFHTASAVTLFAPDTFNGSTSALGWTEGGGFNSTKPTVITSGGPDGSNHLLNVSNGGGGAGSRLIMWNDSPKWTGDYLGAGATMVSFDIANDGPNDVDVRLAFNGAGGWFVTPSASVTSGSGWQDLSFALDGGSLSHATGGTAAFSDTMGGVSRVELIHHPSGTFSAGGGGAVLRGQAVEADVRFDNFEIIPEPSTGALLLLGSLLVGRRRRA